MKLQDIKDLEVRHLVQHQVLEFGTLLLQFHQLQVMQRQAKKKRLVGETDGMKRRKLKEKLLVIILVGWRHLVLIGV